MPSTYKKKSDPVIAMTMAMIFVMGLCVGAKWGAHETAKAYGYSHEKLFLRK